MNALREAYPAINAIKKELTILIGICMLIITLANFIIIFENVSLIKTSNIQIWIYDLVALFLWIINVLTWLATYWNLISDNKIIHLIFFFTPIILLVWGAIVISTVTEILSSGLWFLFLGTFTSSIVMTTLISTFIFIEIKKMRENDSVDMEDTNGIRGTYQPLIGTKNKQNIYSDITTSYI